MIVTSDQQGSELQPSLLDDSIAPWFAHPSEKEANSIALVIDYWDTPAMLPRRDSAIRIKPNQCGGLSGGPENSKNKKALVSKGLVIKLAERVGFEPTVPCSTPDFESGTFDHSATSPQRPA